jgi:hypothetical protein
MNRNFRLYVAFARNVELLNRCIDSVVPQIREHSTWQGKKIVIINDSGEDIAGQYHHPEEVEIYEKLYRVKLSPAVIADWYVKDAYYTGQPFAMTLHTDAALLPGAMQDILEKYDEVENTKWGMIFGGAGWEVYALYNPKFFVEENVWHAPHLFPFYYQDNHLYRIMALRGWQKYQSHSQVPTIIHKSSHYLKEDPIFRRKNDIAFPAHGAIYAAIWGGLPGYEKSNDKYASGTLPRKQE